MKKHFNSITAKISIIELIIIIFVTAILMVSVLSSGVMDALTDKSHISFSKNTEINKSIIEYQLAKVVGDINKDVYDILDLHENLAQSNGELEPNDINLFLEQSATIVIDMLNYSSATGAFIILNNENGSDKYPSLYFKDTDTNVTYENPQDIILFRGSTTIADMFSPSLQLHPQWELDSTLTEDTIDILDVPTELALKNVETTDLNKLGYWQVSKDAASSNQSILTYSLPLIDSNGNVFGIVGVEIIEEYFCEMFPSSELEDGTLGYILTTVDSYTQEITPALIYGDTLKEIIPINEPLLTNVIDSELGLYELSSTSADFKVFATSYFLDVYDDMAYTGDGWVLIGIANGDILQDAVNKFTDTLFNTIIGILIVGVLISNFVGRGLAKPIVTLATKVKSNDAETILSLGKTKTGFTEIDELASAIAGFSKKEKEASLKTDKILQMVNLPLGTFEYSKEADFVKCSTATLKLLDLLEVTSRENFEQRLNIIRANVEDVEDNIYMVKGQTNKWFKLISFEDDNSVLGICMDVTKEVIDRHLMAFERDYDGLSKLLNRTAFRRTVDLLFQNGIKEISAFVMFDLDNLKYINDTYGHDMGDHYIKSVASIFTDVLGSKSTVGRRSGDEFYIFLQGFDSKKDILDLLKKVYQSFEEHLLILPDGKLYKPRMSGGIAWYGDDSSNLDELISFADFAMMQGKNTTKGELKEFNKKNYQSESYMLNGREELNNVLDNDLIDYEFQPIISAYTGEIYGYEALMRPRSDILNSPLKLLRLATTQAQLWKIERITFEKTLAFYIENKELFNDCKLFINSIPNEILPDEILDEISLVYSDILKNLVIEIIENEKLDTCSLDKKRELVAKWGSLMALDDYGAGYNSDISLLTLKPDIVKIDRIMITEIENDTSRQSMVQKLILFAKEQNILVLAEGVETYPQMEYLINAGVDLLQGWYISKSRPLPDYDTDIIEKEIKGIHNTGNL